MGQINFRITPFPFPIPSVITNVAPNSFRRMMIGLEQWVVFLFTCNIVRLRKDKEHNYNYNYTTKLEIEILRRHSGVSFLIKIGMPVFSTCRAKQNMSKHKTYRIRSCRIVLWIFLAWVSASSTGIPN